MALPGAGASCVAGIEFAAWRGANVVDRAGNGLADGSCQRYATRRRRIGAAQADDGQRHRHRQFGRNALAPGKGTAGQLSRMKIDAKACTASAAGLANAHGKVTLQRHSSWPEARYFFSNGVIGSSVAYGSASTGSPVSKVSARAISSM